MMTPGIKTSKPCTMMSTYNAGCPAKAGAKSRWQSGLARRSWLPSRSASGFSGHPSSRQDSRCSSWPRIPGPIVPQLLPLPTKRPMRRWWHLQGGPNNEPLLWLWSSRKGWVTPLTANTPPTTNALPATGGPNPLDSEEKVLRLPHAVGELKETKRHPGQHHTKGPPWRKNKPGHPAKQDGNVGWNSLKEMYQCQKWQEKTQGARQKNASVTSRCKQATSCPHHYGRGISSRPVQQNRCWIRHDGPNHPVWGWGCRPQVLTPTWAPSPATPGAGIVHSGRCSCRTQPPSATAADAIITTTTTTAATSWGSRALPLHATKWIVVHQVCSDYILVGRVDASPRPHRLSRVCLEGACLLWGTCIMQLGKEGEKSLHAISSTNPSWQTSLPTAEGHEVCQPWHLPQWGTAYHHLCNGFAVLGQVGAPPVPDQPHHLAESMQELQQVMELLVSFGEKEVFVTMVPSNLTEVTLPQSTDITLQPPQESWKHHTHNTRACPRGSMTMAQSEDRHAATATQATAAMEAFTTPPQEFRPCQPPSDSKTLHPPSGFLGIAQILRTKDPMESSPPPVVTGIPTQETIDHYKVMGMAVTAARLLRNQATGRCWWTSRSAVKESWAWGSSPRTVRWQMSAPPWPSRSFQNPTVEPANPPLGIHLIHAVTMQCFCPVDMPWCFTAVFLHSVLLY